MKFTDIFIKNLKPKDKSYKVFDGNGLFILVNTKGKKSWRGKYYSFGKERLITYGDYPTVSLKEARDKHQNSKKLLEQGIDPSLNRQKEKVRLAEKSNDTFNLIAQEYLQFKIKEGISKKTITKHKWLIGLLNQAIERYPVTEIKSSQLLNLFNNISDSGRKDTAKQTCSLANRIFEYATAIGKCETNPAANLSKYVETPKVNSRAAILEPKKIGGLLRAIENFDGVYYIKIASKILPHVFSRPGELRNSEWNEFNFQKKIWSIPATKMKMGRPHDIPLSEQVIKMLLELKKIETGSSYLFPSIRTLVKPISDNTLNAVLRRLGYTSDEVCSHGWRSTASTLLYSSGKWRSEVIEMQLSHVKKDKTESAYNRSEYWEERVEMMQWYSDYLDSLKNYN